MTGIRNGFLVILAVAAHLLLPRDAAAQEIHTPNDHIPDFAANPTIRSAVNGSWSSPSTWTPARLPGANDVVSITHTVLFETTAGDADVVGVETGGTLRFATGQSTRLRVGILMVLPNGRLEVGTAANPVAPSVTAEILIKDKPINLTIDPNQFGTGLLAVDGVVTMHGAVKAPTFIRTSVEPRAGHTTVTLEQAASGWQVGDRVFLPDTRQVPVDKWFNASWPLQIETRTIQNISGDGKTVTLSTPLSFDHRGARDANGTPTVLANGIRLLPHVGNLTRNVIIRSENPSGTRGHTLYTNRSDVRISYVQFQDLGRTKAIALDSSSNKIGRYPLHIHHVWGPTNPTNTGYQFAIVGNAVNDTRKWPIAIHGSHYGLIKQNVVFGGSDLSGAGIAIEDGTETENLIEENFVANINGDLNSRHSGPSTADGSTPGSAAECFWSNGFNNRFVNNVAASCRNPAQQIVAGVGYKFIVPPGPYSARNPRFRGADMTNTSQTLAVVPQNQPILEFRGNELYGLAADGFTTWNLGTDGYDIMPASMGESVLKDFRVWHTYEGAIWNYPINRVTIDGLVWRIDPAVTVYWLPAIASGDYRNVNMTIRGGSVHAGSVLAETHDPLGTLTIENVDAITRDHAFYFHTPATPGTGADRPTSGVTVILRNNRVSAWPGQPLRTIEMDHDLSKANSQPDDKYEVWVYDYQGQAGNDFRAFYGVQASQNLYGGLAPCSNTTARPEVSGITCPMSGSPGMPAKPTNLRITP
jgi:hypothetical protein